MNVRIGTSGFSFPDWRGTVYPESLKKEDALTFYSGELGLDCVEVNASYYAIISEKSFVGMEKKTPPDFIFTVRSYRGTTHDPFDPRLGSKKPDLKKAEDDTRRFASSLRPLTEKNKLGAVLLQFPPFFTPGDFTKQYILSCAEWLKNTAPIVVEFRNHEWNREEHFAFLKSNGLGCCVVDEPRLDRLMPFENRVTAEPAYFRFHGRNKNWFNAPVSERYDYLYTDEELRSFVPEIKKAAGKAQKTYLFFNNCHRGSAVKNAVRLKEMLEGLV